MKILLHTCCAPCLSGSRIPFEEEGFEITGLWFNPNIQPFTEHERRVQTLQRYLFLDPIGMEFVEGYPQIAFMRKLMNDTLSKSNLCDAQFMDEDERKRRCRSCYEQRMKRTADEAKKLGYDCFSTTLLLSKHQDHEEIGSVCRKISSENEIEFIYKDLRKNWKDSMERSRQLKLYRQSYCGCIFSEHERYELG
jgi:predicted adenine nucleotide alpha hydrolase (AANH) superfamily ATPase